MSDTFKTGICKWCDEKGEIYRDNLLCEDCDNSTIYCRVCRARQSSDSRCRHVFEDQYFNWSGAGCCPYDEEMKAPFHRLLSAMSEDFARELKSAIKSGQFYTWLSAPMIGGGGILDVNGTPRSHEWGNKLLKLGESPHAEALADGYHWLASLYKTDTTKANRTTVRWIDQWLWPFTPSL